MRDNAEIDAASALLMRVGPEAVNGWAFTTIGEGRADQGRKADLYWRDVRDPGCVKTRAAGQDKQW
jgi:hypothetical protein